MITIVLPVYNGGALLHRCIDSIARQDAERGSFELVVLDNCSTDGALEALHALPERIPRRVYRSERVLPIERNWARITGIPGTGEFLTMIGHDDALDPGFIRIMSRTLKDEPEVRLLLAHFRLIDQNDQILRSCLPMGPWESAGQFLAARLCGIRDSFGTGYVARFDDYREVGGIPGYPTLIYADDALWVTLARRSRIRILAEECFSYRMHPASMSHTEDAELPLYAFSRYVEFLETQMDDPGVRRAVTTYGPSYVERLAAGWISRETSRANYANEVARAHVIDGWRELYGRFLSIVERPDLFRGDPEELAFSLWMNETELRRRLYAMRPSRALLRRFRLATRRGARHARGR